MAFERRDIIGACQTDDDVNALPTGLGTPALNARFGIVIFMLSASQLQFMRGDNDAEPENDCPVPRDESAGRYAACGDRRAEM
jgi:hypothetical protein